MCQTDFNVINIQGLYFMHKFVFVHLLFFCQLIYGKFFSTQTSMIENVSPYEVNGEKVLICVFWFRDYAQCPNNLFHL